ncbi:hypothetical protein BAGA_04725 [Bacillus gaemokensis]|uniref:Lipoprotein n=1 Tax=Bacillus gaemokensis TaxID=574375 RepID=A0A073K9R7_9BACI|nr:hypothetical protein BAGA_04725 [Bacillus gaemokensis]
MCKREWLKLKNKVMVLSSYKKIYIIGCVLLLSACGNKGIDGEWELSQEQQNKCPIYYKFETVVKTEKKETITNYLVEMYTNDRIKEDLYKGTYNKENGNAYTLDFNNSFISKQNIKRNGESLEVYFNDVEKLCRYQQVK